VGGDFNFITSLAEKTGGIIKLSEENLRFEQVIDNFRLIDVPTADGLHTWNNRRGGNHRVAVRLDRFLMSDELWPKGYNVVAEVLPSAGSDHWPISLQWDSEGTPRTTPFRFDKFWLSHPHFKDRIKAW